MKRRCAWAALLLRPARRPGGRAGRAWIAHNVVDHQSVPDEQHDHRADGRADQAGAPVEPVPTDGLADTPSHLRLTLPRAKTHVRRSAPSCRS